MRLGIRNLLELQPGWSICAEANNGREAVEKTLQFRPDVIIMDISMPVMNGLEAASLITREHPQIPVILFSLHLSDDLYRHFNTDGIRGRLRKGTRRAIWFWRCRPCCLGEHFFPERNPVRIDWGLVRGNYRSGRRWPVMGSYQRLPLLSFALGYFINNATREPPPSGRYCSYELGNRLENNSGYGDA